MGLLEGDSKRKKNYRYSRLRTKKKKKSPGYRVPTHVQKKKKKVTFSRDRFSSTLPQNTQGIFTKMCKKKFNKKKKKNEIKWLCYTVVYTHTSTNGRIGEFGVKKNVRSYRLGV